MNFQVNQQIKVLNEKNEFFASVEAITDNDISLIVFDAYEVFTVGDTIILETTGNDAVYLCQSNILKIVSGAKNCTCMVSRPDAFSRVQRRESIRVQTKLNVVFRDVEDKDHVPLKGQVLDLSGNGLRLLSETKLAIDTIIIMELVIKTSHTYNQLQIKCKVIRQFKSLSGFQYGLLFVDLLPVDQDKIIKFILYESVKKRTLSSFLAGPN